jgi:hypothetical protein
MKHIKIRALYFKAVRPAMKELDVDDEQFNALCDGKHDWDILHLLHVDFMGGSVRRVQVQYDGKIVYSSHNGSVQNYPCDTMPW